MDSVRVIRSLRALQTPCDTLPVPQNLVVSRFLDAQEGSTTNSSLVSIESVAPQSASASNANMGQGQQTLHFRLLPHWLMKDLDHEMHDGTTSPRTNSSFTESGESTKRKLCVRHQRMADEGANVAMQQVGFVRYRYIRC